MDVGQKIELGMGNVPSPWVFSSPVPRWCLCRPGIPRAGCTGACRVATGISSSWTRRGNQDREFGFTQLLTPGHVSAAGLRFPGVEATRRNVGCSWSTFSFKNVHYSVRVLARGGYFFGSGGNRRDALTSAGLGVHLCCVCVCEGAGKAPNPRISRSSRGNTSTGSKYGKGDYRGEGER